MNYEKTCGAVVFTKKEKEILYVIVQSTKGIYGFPKGHAETNESEQKTAIREIKEETGLNVKILSGFKEEIEYLVPDEKNTTKHLTIFLGEYENQDIRFQKEELISAKLMTFDEAMRVLKYDSLKRILEKADKFIKKRI